MATYFKRIALLFSILMTLNVSVRAQQVPDTSMFFVIEEARYEKGTGPMVYVDASHYNFHTLAGRYAAFGKVLQEDGYQTQDQESVITADVLSECQIYVIANAIHESNQRSWELPNPSAFSDSEIVALKNWVENGGSLFLIADHMPFGGAAEDLAKALGVSWTNSYAMDNRRRNIEYFSKSNDMLVSSPLVAKLDSVVNFTGSAFHLPEGAQGILKLDNNYSILHPQRAWVFTDETPIEGGAGYYQLAYFNFGSGKVVISAEAAMFSAQLSGPAQNPMGMNNPSASQNVALLRSLIGWLSSQ